ncbi:hypothetical protein Nepgr_030956 [Nepenthes gracilis]|uniref:Uncharacterized protein n=1 Tax=Nepenthes gracilis TaxID=150966 RepID=A0AAD3Y4Q6_NEPGR|nr:hypothetical protein Nepgr_030956 [Nepenthes gracilis]
MDSLAGSFKKFHSNLDFNFHPKRENVGITHLALRDDLIILAEIQVLDGKIVIMGIRILFTEEGESFLLANIQLLWEYVCRPDKVGDEAWEYELNFEAPK